MLRDEDLLSKQASRFALKAKGFFLYRILFVTYLYLFEWKLFLSCNLLVFNFINLIRKKMLRLEFQTI